MIEYMPFLSENLKEGLESIILNDEKKLKDKKEKHKDQTDI